MRLSSMLFGPVRPSKPADRRWSPRIEGLEDRYLLSYSIVSLGGNGRFQANDATAINDAGQAVGQESKYRPPTNVYHAFLYSDGRVIDLGRSPGNGRVADGINNAGQVVGLDQAGHAFLYSDGAFTDLGTLGGTFSDAYGINDADQIVGESTASSGYSHAFLYQDGVMTDLGTLGGTLSRAWAINQAGLVVGDARLTSEVTHAFLYQDGVMTDLGTLVGNNDQAASAAYAVNDLGQVVGASDASTQMYPPSHAFLYSNGVMTDLGTLGGSDSYSRAYGINDAGQVVGDSFVPSLGTRPFLYQDGTMTDLNDLLPPGSGWTLYIAQGINASGQIVGEGMYQGQIRAFLMTPDGGQAGDAAHAPFALGSEAVGPQSQWTVLPPANVASVTVSQPLSGSQEGSTDVQEMPLAASGWHHMPHMESTHALDLAFADPWSLS